MYAHTGRPSAPIRLMISLLLLKQRDNLGNETVVAKWAENPYYQYFGGMEIFQWKLSIDPTHLVKFRQRIGEEGMRQIFIVLVGVHDGDAMEDQQARKALRKLNTVAGRMVHELRRNLIDQKYGDHCLCGQLQW